jgi:hypothetical protein
LCMKAKQKRVGARTGSVQSSGLPQAAKQAA